ncbi:ABC transporter permease [Thermomicrobium roseum]|jgi:ABC-type dipeptide/oligopeptide/nickel transport system permease component|uniref:Oligopeptide transport system permease protein AppB n=1 Tax=Thermomicrobium roseum (strain ATCC 27502 / DSM 5159 / P-2) TaxID=309801 RepID=B9L4I6_THERP|nr:ABC transporter permease [Thermomicrobium roseum]ACM06880.1 oligopeptide transport system permease protein AppB [Thermomicrobium roseum DSM 5159]
MVAFLIRRILGLVLVWLGVTILVFSIMHLAPGDPAMIILGPKATAESLARLRHELGLDQPLPVQYLRWLGNVLQGDFGRSLQLKRDVSELLWTRFRATALLATAATVIAVAIGLTAGVVSATRQYSVWDRAAMLLALLGFCLPVFWLGLILQIGLAYRLPVFPVSGMNAPGQSGFLDTLHHLVLPAVTLGIGPAAVIARMTRSSVLEVIRQDFVRTARAKGLAERVVILRHVLRNALIPVLTIVGLQVGYLFGGAVLVEMVFSWPGLGLLMVNGILARDFPVVQGAVLVVATTYVLVNLLVDVLYTLVDPRVRT